MAERIDYQIEKYSFAEVNQTPRITQQWTEVIEECRQAQAGSIERLRIALLNVDYVTSFELPFRLLLVRAPQLIAGLRDELQLSQKNVLFNGKRFGCVYSVKADLSKVPDEFQYRLSTRIRREGPSGDTAAPYREIAKEIKMPRERLKQALEDGLTVTALDGLFWFGMQRIAADVAMLRKKGMRIATSEVQVWDSFTATLRRVPVYRGDHRSRTCPGPLAAPTGFEVQPPHRGRGSSSKNRKQEAIIARISLAAKGEFEFPRSPSYTWPPDPNSRLLSATLAGPGLSTRTLLEML